MPATRTKMQLRQPKRAVPLFEYTELVTVGRIGQAELDAMGRDGWQLFSTVPTADGRTEHSFRRPAGRNRP